MSYKIIAIEPFKKDAKRLINKFPSLKREIEDLANVLLDNPTAGTPIGKNCYKIRLAISSKGKGKSGGARLITYVVIKSQNIYMLTIYDKSEREDISQKELKSLLKLVPHY